MSQENKVTTEQSNSSWGSLLARANALVNNYSRSLSIDAMYSAFSRAGGYWANMPRIQNSRLKSISSLPLDYDKEKIGEFLRNPYSYEKELRQTAEVLSWTAYPFYKIGKTIADIPTYRHYVKPLYSDENDAADESFKREARLLDKFNKEFEVERKAHEATAKAVYQGKVAFYPRYDVDKAHNQIRFATWQQLPQDWTVIIGKNNVSGWTVSFNLMYFLQPGTDFRQYGDLFRPYMDDFGRMFEHGNDKEKIVYQSKKYRINIGNKQADFFPENINPRGTGNPQIWTQNGEWCYWVTLPVEKIWVFEIDERTPATASVLSGLVLTYAQQSDFENAQLQITLNPLLMFLTGEIPYTDGNTATIEDSYKLSIGGRALFEKYFYDMLRENNTSGVGWFTAPVENIKSHTFSESANANDIAESFNRYGMEKAGLAGIIPVDDDVKASQVDASTKIESRFATATIYPQFCRMMNHIYDTLNLNYDWEFVMFGSIFNEDKIRDNALKALANGDTSAHFILAALDGQSWLDKVSMMKVIKASGLLELLEPPATSYTQTGKNMASGTSASQTTGRPKTDVMTDEKETAVDAGITEAG